MARRPYKRKDRQPSFIQQQISEMREAMAAEKRNDPLPVTVSRQDPISIGEAETISKADDAELVASMRRLEKHGYSVAVREHPQTYRIIENETQRGIALTQGFSVWNPRDMLEYVHLSPDQREKLRRFKKVFPDAGFDWGKYRG